MLSLQNTSVHYGAATVLDDVSLDLHAGELTVVLGPNGAGKSTLLKVACGELAIKQGRVEFCDKPLKNWVLREKAQRMAVLPQNSLLTFPYRVSEVVLLGRTPHETGAKVDADIVARALQEADVSYLQDKLYTQLSGGEKQRVQLARVLAQVWQDAKAESGNVLILDEPTAALDFSHQKQVLNALKDKAKQGDTVLMALHDLNLASAYADKIVLMCCGQIRAVGTPDEVLREDLLKDIFQLDFHRVSHPQTGRPLLVF